MISLSSFNSIHGYILFFHGKYRQLYLCFNCEEKTRPVYKFSEKDSPPPQKFRLQPAKMSNAKGSLACGLNVSATTMLDFGLLNISDIDGVGQHEGDYGTSEIWPLYC